MNKNIYLHNITKKYGTPLYVYDANKIEYQYKLIKQSFSYIENLKINYACKANTNISILKFLKKLGSGLDTVSIQEIEIGLKAGFKPKEIIYTPNSVSLSEIKKAIKAGVRINIDNLSLLEQIGNDNPNYPIGIRINPHILGGGNKKISVGHIDSKFGISYYQLPHIKKIVENTGIKVEGIHMHTGSDILDIGVFLQGADILLNVASFFNELKYIDFGSGFKVPYKKNDTKTDIDMLGVSLKRKFLFFCEKYCKKLKLFFEPGKFLVSESGSFLVKVNVIKHTTSTVFAGVDSGFNHFIRPMFYDSYHHIDNISNPSGILRFYTVVGYICESDTFCVNRKINEIREGDLLCFRNAGAYCFSMSSNYNSRYRPSEVIIYNNKDFLIRKRENLQDLLNNMIEIEL
ncbi:diaminopimelate decarboxylase [Candidatus Karelsulcia muelleri CARI]|uniref:Diaminopimelate decarboxylase n=1 Tax=Karelsulcia muelleri (strain CARI) TaxID=706194 RepID=E0TJI0_KARMC|nr:diaminopimelate decarboxylase [Candidatus Karelsulcia muelleri CARI]